VSYITSTRIIRGFKLVGEVKISGGTRGRSALSQAGFKRRQQLEQITVFLGRGESTTIGLPQKRGAKMEKKKKTSSSKKDQ